MSLSIRNQIAGTVTDVTRGDAMAVVKTRLDGGQEITAAVTREAVDDLGLARGTAVHALIKSTEVALATSAAPVPGLSIRNQFPGTVSGITQGDAMTAVRITVPGTELTAAITTESATALNLTVGTLVTALVKSTEVSLSTA